MAAGAVIQFKPGMTKKSFKRRWKKAKKATTTVAKIARNVVMNMSEKHYFDYTNTHSLTTTWALTAISNVQQIGGDTGRDGDEIIQKSLMMKFGLSGADATNNCRIVVIRFLADGNPTAAQIFSNDATVYSPLSMYNHDNRKLFNVVYDSGVVAVANAAGGRLHVARDVSVNLKQTKQRFDGGTTNNVKGALYLFYASDSSAASHPTLVIRTRMNFIDP